MRPAASDPVQACILPLPSARKYVAVRLLTGETLFFVVEAKAKARDLLSALVRHLGTLGMVSYDLFGLAFLLDGEYLFLEPDAKLAKYAPKIWKASHGSGLDTHGSPLLTFHFRVQYYVDNPLFLRDRVTRYHFYLQLRENVVHYSQPCGEDTFLLLAALALQVDFGDLNEDKHRGQYFDLNCYLPRWIIERLGDSYLYQHVASLHRNQRGVTQSVAQMSYIKEASQGDCYHSLHIYRLKHSKKSEKGDPTRERSTPVAQSQVISSETSTTPQPTTSVWLGIATRGVDIYEADENSLKTLRAGLLWPSIGKLCFERKKFELRAVGQSENKKFTYYASSEVKCKHLLYLCRATHQFSMKIAEDVRNTKDCPANLAWAAENGLPHPSDANLASIQNLGSMGDIALGSLVEQRVSMISSSSTTSGIASDRVLSIDSEDEGRGTVLGQVELRDLPTPRLDGKQSASPATQSCDFVDGRPQAVRNAKPDWSGDVPDGLVRSENTEESEYWYACDDDASDAGSTSEHCTGVMCDCRRVRASSPDSTHPHVCTLSADTLRAHSPGGHNKVPSGISESSSLVVSVGNTQDSDCHSVYHSYLSSEDSTKAQNFYLDELNSEQSTLTQKDSKDLSVIINSALINQRKSPVPSRTGCGTLQRKEKESPQGLDLTVQSAVPSGGTYPRRSTISSTFDTDSDYVEFSPAEANQLFNSYEPCHHHAHGSKPESPRKKAETEKPTAMVFGSHTVPRNVALATITPVPLAASRVLQPKDSQEVERGQVEVQARFIRSKPTISILQAYEFVPPPVVPCFAQPLKPTFTIPPPAYPGTQFTPIHPSKQVTSAQFVAQPRVAESLPCLVDTTPENPPFIARLKPGFRNEKQPVIGTNNYLDVRASNSLLRPQKKDIQDEQYLLGIPPPPQYPGHRMPTAYNNNKVKQAQIEQYKAQLYSDVDYVIYPLKDPALSEQEYMDFKEASSVGVQEYILPETLPPPPPYRPAVYRSTPNVAQQSNGETYGYSSNHSLTSSNYSSNYSTSNYSSNYSANQLPIAYVPYPRLSTKYVSTQSLASSHSSNPSAYSASTHSASLAGSYEPIGEARRAALRARTGLIHRVHSEESILSLETNEAPFVVPPPPPYRKSSASSNPSSLPQLVPPPEGYKQAHFGISTLPHQRSGLNNQKAQSVQRLNGGRTEDHRFPHKTCTLPHPPHSKLDQERVLPSTLDFKTIIEQTRTKDLPLLNALCSDPSLQHARKELLGLGSKSTPGLAGERDPAKGSFIDVRRNFDTLPKSTGSSKPTETLPKASIQSQPLPPIPGQCRTPAKTLLVTKQPTMTSAKPTDIKPFDPATTPLPPLPVEAAVESQNFSKQLFAKAVNRHSYAVSPGKTKPQTTGLYAISDLPKPSTVVPKKPATFCHVHHQMSAERLNSVSQKPK